ncbi:MAG: serine/threonine protein kinase [Candidatus Riflebacteria bacterium]|nr:serine/threonine protein kinase [Candidatus Riflebacteria bacterium]
MMELIQGAPLHVHIRDHSPLDPAFVLAVACSLTEAMVYLHERGVSHRDLKPANVLVGNDGTVRLVDFGLARDDRHTMLTEEGDVLGTFSYLAPEVLLGQRSGMPADLYALGLIIYEMLVGYNPFRSTTVPVQLRKILQEHAKAPSTLRGDVPPEIDPIVAALMAKSPAERPALAEVAGQLDRISVRLGLSAAARRRVVSTMIDLVALCSASSC